MSTHKYIERICAIATLIVIVLSILFMNAEKFGIQPASQSKEYENTLFDTSVVHTIDIQMDDWDSFLDTCINEEYSLCSLTIDGETYSNVAAARGTLPLPRCKVMEMIATALKLTLTIMMTASTTMAWTVSV